MQDLGTVSPTVLGQSKAKSEVPGGECPGVNLLWWSHMGRGTGIIGPRNQRSGRLHTLLMWSGVWEVGHLLPQEIWKQGHRDVLWKTLEIHSWRPGLPEGARAGGGKTQDGWVLTTDGTFTLDPA